MAYGAEKGSQPEDYGLRSGRRRSFDVSILDIGDGVVEVLSTNGNTRLGGDDFDEAIMKYLASEFQKENGIDLSSDKVAMQRLKEAAEKGQD